jgi:hypothetical protein
LNTFSTPFLDVNLLGTTLQLITIMLKIYLISEFGDLLRDLPAAFSDPRVKILSIGGAHSALNKQENFIEIQKLPDKTFIQSLLLEEDLINSIDGLVLIGSDPEMREIAQAEVKLDTKMKLLPIKNPQAFKILDSKVGLQMVIQELKLSGPTGIAIENKEELDNQRKHFKVPYLIKGDQGGGGAHIRKVSSDQNFPNINDIPFPLVFQEEVIGSEISVDAYFVNGTLRAYIYSDQIKSMTKYGPSYLRRVAQPPAEDFVKTLQTIGEFAGAHGLVNTTFIFDAELNTHFIVEFDPRPTAWHFLAPTLGIDLVSAFTGPKSEIIETTDRVNIRIIHLNRFIYYLSEFVNPWRYLKALSEVFDPELLVIRGKRLTRFEILIIFISQSPRIAAFKILRKLFRILPEVVTDPLKHRKITNQIARKILGRI